MNSALQTITTNNNAPAKPEWVELLEESAAQLISAASAAKFVSRLAAFTGCPVKKENHIREALAHFLRHALDLHFHAEGKQNSPDDEAIHSQLFDCYTALDGSGTYELAPRFEGSTLRSADVAYGFIAQENLHETTLAVVDALRDLSAPVTPHDMFDVIAQELAK